MSAKRTFRDLITQYGGQLHLPWIPLRLPGVNPKSGIEYEGKEPLGAALRLTHGKTTPYFTTNPDPEQQLLWYADFSADMGGPGFNPGIITGHNSVDPNAALYVVDIDWTNIPPDCLMDCHTTTVRSGNGFHFWYSGTAGAYSSTDTLRLPGGVVCEFKGVEGLIVAPPGLHKSGRSYDFLPLLGPDVLQPLPDFIIEGLPMKQTPKRDTLLHGKPLPFYSKGRLCLDQIWGRELQAPGPNGKGERDIALYILWQRGCTVGNKPESVARAVYWKNDTTKPPLSAAQVSHILHGGLEQDKPGNRWGAVGCNYTRQALPWVRCEDCKYGGGKVSASLGVALRHKLTAAEWFLLSYTIQKGYRSDRSAADACGMDRETVKRAREHLLELKLWPNAEDAKAE